MPSAQIEIHGGKNSKTSLVKYALEQKNKNEYNDREIWCVFDMDIKPDESKTQPEDFNNSIVLTEKKWIKSSME